MEPSFRKKHVAKDASRIEWYWWRKYSDVKTIWDKDTKTLNTCRPGINYVKRDMKKYNHDNIDEYISNLELISRKNPTNCESY